MIVIGVEKKREAVILEFEGGEKTAFDPKTALAISIGDSTPNLAISENEAFAYSYGLRKALKYLKAAKSEKAVITYLNKLYIQEGAQKRVISYLKAKRYIDDESYALLFRMARPSLSQKEITQKLIMRGIPKALALVGEEEANESDLKCLISWFQKEAEAKMGIPQEILKRDLYIKASRRGFASGLILKAFESIDAREYEESEATIEWAKKNISKRLARYSQKGFSRQTCVSKVVSEFTGYGISEEDCESIASDFFEAIEG